MCNWVVDTQSKGGSIQSYTEQQSVCLSVYGTCRALLGEIGGPVQCHGFCHCLAGDLWVLLCCWRSVPSLSCAQSCCCATKTGASQLCAAAMLQAPLLLQLQLRINLLLRHQEG
jgi:hypothetical protein